MWADVFGNAPIALAIADRLYYRCHLIRITGSSYRIKDLPAASLSQRRAQAPILADPIAPTGADILLKSVSLGLTLAIEGDYLSFMVGVTYLKARVDYRICPMGLSRDAMKELIGFRLKE